MKKPEEIIMAVLAALWVILTYFVLTYIGAHLETSLTITGLTLLGVWWPLYFGKRI